MKLTNEQIKELFGSLPPEVEWKKLVGVKYQLPSFGEMYLFYGSKWRIADCDKDDYSPVAIYESVAQPTTIEDLVGEDGQKIVWIHVDQKNVAQTMILIGEDGLFDFFTGGETHSIEKYIRCGTRWSHSPRTPYEEANEFVVV